MHHELLPRTAEAEVVPFRGHFNGDRERGVIRGGRRARGNSSASSVIHHIPGWCEWTTEVVRKLAHHGYAAISPHLYFREGSPGEAPDDLGARIRAAGGVADAQVMGDVTGAMAYLRAQPNATGKIGVIGFCSGGRHTYLAACTISGIDAAVDCWGGNVIVDNPKDLNAKRPVAPIDLTEKMNCPLLGIFGNDDANPTADQLNRTQAVQKKLAKKYEYNRYDCAGQPIFNTLRDTYPPRAGDRRLAQGLRLLRSPSGGVGQQHRRRIEERTMCSYIVEKAALVGSAKGRKGWMKIDTANVYFDHPYYSTLDHVLAIDFTNEGEGGRDRVAVELSAESARALVERILAALASGEVAHAAASGLAPALQV